MDFRVPKPLHGWREFLGEVGIIVIGILIALGGEQMVEHWRQKSELREAEDAMVAELRDDDLPQAYARAAIFNCYADQLDGIEAAVQAGDRDKFLSLSNGYQPIYRTWDDEAWKSAVASQVLVNAGTQRMLDWATAYIAIPVLSDAAKAEAEKMPQLRAGLSGTGRLSPEQQDRLLGVIAYLRHYNRQMNGSSLVFMRFLDKVGLDLTAKAKADLLADARSRFGSCVSEPSPERLNMTTQISVTNDAELGRKRAAAPTKP